ncbi:MAG TPA: hypothetical protein VL981_07235 [Candidatus Methylacidiphilales bacterium]|nr:hypothetical protein [Candidatus Methylacidiphilales bacterium]
MGRLTRPVGGLVAVSDFVVLGRLFGALGGRTIRWVDRTDCAMPCRAGLRPELPARGMTIGWVVAAPDGIPDAGINPAG